MTVEQRAGNFAHDYEIECAMFVGVHPKTVAFQSYLRGYNDGAAALTKERIKAKALKISIIELLAICKKYANDNPYEDLAMERAENTINQYNT